MTRWAICALLTALLCAGCSNKDFEGEILGGTPPPPAQTEPAPETAGQPGAAYGEQGAAAPAAPAPQSPAPVQPPAPAVQPPPQAPAPVYATGEILTFQAGSFAHQDNAASLAAMLSGHGYQSRVEAAQVNGKAYFRTVAEVPGPEPQARQALAGLGVTDARLLSRSGAAQPGAAARPVPVANPQAVPGDAPAPAQSPAPEPAPIPAPEPAPVPAAAAPGAVSGGYPPYCLIGAARIEAVGKTQAQGKDALMAGKEATQDAKRNLLICIDLYKNQGRPAATAYKIEAYLPDNLVQMGAPVSQSDGTVAVRASIAVSDVGAVSITRR